MQGNIPYIDVMGHGPLPLFLIDAIRFSRGHLHVPAVDFLEYDKNT